MASIMDIRLFHTMERNIYTRLVRVLDRDPLLAQKIIALWLWLESIGHADIIRFVHTLQDRVLLQFVKEAERCLHVLKPGVTPPTLNNDIPVTAGLINEPINLRFFYYHKEAVINGIESICDNVCSVIFEQINVGSSMRLSAHDSNTSTQAGSGLNPRARPFSPHETTPDDLRSMFLTFSKGYPIERDEIIEFFTESWGNVVEDVRIERTPPGVSPMFGRIIFGKISVIPLILNGQRTAKFLVNGRQLWARMYTPRRD